MLSPMIGQIALEHVLFVRIEAAIAHERILAILLLVALPVGNLQTPAIGHRDEVRDGVAQHDVERGPLAAATVTSR